MFLKQKLRDAVVYRAQYDGTFHFLDDFCTEHLLEADGDNFGFVLGIHLADPTVSIGYVVGHRDDVLHRLAHGEADLVFWLRVPLYAVGRDSSSVHKDFFCLQCAPYGGYVAVDVTAGVYPNVLVDPCHKLQLFEIAIAGIVVFNAHFAQRFQSRWEDGFDISKTANDEQGQQNKTHTKYSVDCLFQECKNHGFLRGVICAPMRVYLDSVGCRLNEAEIATWRLGFLDRGHAVVSRVEDADLAVFNSCAVTVDAARSSRKRVRSIHRLNQQTKIVLTGCYASLDREQAGLLEGVDLLLDNQEKDQLVSRVLEEVSQWDMPARALDPDAPGLVNEDPGRSRAFLKVQDGCRHRCTYCIVTVARGAERSRTVEDLVSEVHRLEEVGHSEVVLTGVHLGGYGNDLGTDLTDLVRRLLAETSIPRIRLGSLEPWRLDERFFALWKATDRLMPHLHLPLQSGSNSVLRRMGRRSSTESYRALVHAAREAIPGFHLSTDLIVGFPGESDAEFEESMTFAEEMGFGQVHIFSYSRREGTVAARMKGQLDRATKRERSRRLHEAANRWKNQVAEKAVGQTTRVLWERPTQPDCWHGYSENYLRVTAPAPSQAWQRGLVLPVQIQTVGERADLHGKWSN